MPSFLILLTPFILFLSLCIGTIHINVDEVWSVLINLTPIQTSLDFSQTNKLIIEELRIPRTVLAWFVGATLAVTGAAMQGLFRNPLADPSIIGVTSGASLGASVAAVLMNSFLPSLFGLSIVVIGSFLGGLAAVILVYKLSSSATFQYTSIPFSSFRGASVATMLLLGIAITAFAGALNSTLIYISDNETLRRISLWSMGGVDSANYQHIIIALVVIMPSLIILFNLYKSLDVLLLGESEAQLLGVNTKIIKLLIVSLVALSVSTSVALAGVIGFVGLLVPHFFRLILGPNHRDLMLCSIFGGGIFLIIADILSRILFSPSELPIGIITAIIGAPFFIIILRQPKLKIME